MVEYAISIGVIEESTPKGWFTFKGEKVRKKQLTESPMFDTILIEAMKVRDAALAPVAETSAS